MRIEEGKNIIESFYKAFTALDADLMASFYHDEIEFQDPAFGVLKGKDVGDMWRMLCKRSNDLKIEYSVLEVENDSVKARWEAWYTFSKTGRKVHNIVQSKFTFSEGKIIKHHDHFDLHRWASQALGLKGRLMGGTNFFKKSLQGQTKKLLKRFQEIEEN